MLPINMLKCIWDAGKETNLELISYFKQIMGQNEESISC